MELLIVAVIIWILPMYVGHQIGEPKHRHGFWWAAFLGWIGVIIVALLPPTQPHGEPWRPPAR